MQALGFPDMEAPGLADSDQEDFEDVPIDEDTVSSEDPFKQPPTYNRQDVRRSIGTVLRYLTNTPPPIALFQMASFTDATLYQDMQMSLLMAYKGRFNSNSWEWQGKQPLTMGEFLECLAKLKKWLSLMSVGLKKKQVPEESPKTLRNIIKMISFKMTYFSRTDKHILDAFSKVNILESFLKDNLLIK